MALDMANGYGQSREKCLEIIHLQPPLHAGAQPLPTPISDRVKTESNQRLKSQYVNLSHMPVWQSRHKYTGLLSS